MTPQDYRDKKIEILNDYRDDVLTTDQTIKALNTLHDEYLAAQARPHYTLMQRVDNGREAIRASEGRLAVTCAAVRGLMIDLQQWLESIEPKPYDGYKKGDFAMYGDDKVKIDHRYPNGVYNISWYPKDGGLAQSAVTAAALTPIEEQDNDPLS